MLHRRILMSNSNKAIKDNNRKGVKHWQVITALLIVFDLFAVAASYFFALMMRFDFSFSHIESRYLTEYLYTIPALCIISVLVFAAFKMYLSIWSWLYNWNNSEKWLKINVFRRLLGKYFSRFLPSIRKNIKSWLLECSDLTKASENNMYSVYAA